MRKKTISRDTQNIVAERIRGDRYKYQAAEWLAGRGILDINVDTLGTLLRATAEATRDELIARVRGDG